MLLTCVKAGAPIFDNSQQKRSDVRRLTTCAHSVRKYDLRMLSNVCCHKKSIVPNHAAHTKHRLNDSDPSS